MNLNAIKKKIVFASLCVALSFSQTQAEDAEPQLTGIVVNSVEELETALAESEGAKEPVAILLSKDLAAQLIEANANIDEDSFAVRHMKGFGKNVAFGFLVGLLFAAPVEGAACLGTYYVVSKALLGTSHVISKVSNLPGNAYKVFFTAP